MDQTVYGSLEDPRMKLFSVQETTQHLPPPRDGVSDLGNLQCAREGDALAILNCPTFVNRPSQADVLHLDFWAKGVNVLRDGGTYSYVGPQGESLAETGGHNTIEFDGRSQMPRIGRFLYGEWLAVNVADRSKCLENAVAASYKDPLGAQHRRAVELSSGVLICTDEINGAFEKAVLRWRLIDIDWRLTEKGITSKDFDISITVDDASVTLKIVEMDESRYYQQSRKVPAIYLEFFRPCVVKTTLTIKGSGRV
jgi:hypothetical protein